MDSGSISAGAQLSLSVNFALMKKVMASAEQHANLMTKMLEVNTRIIQQSVQPHLGGNIDLRI